MAEIYEFLRYLDAPSFIVEKAPSAGLYDGQTDEDEMGITYRRIDEYLLNGMVLDKDKKQSRKCMKPVSINAKCLFHMVHNEALLKRTSIPLNSLVLSKVSRTRSNSSSNTVIYKKTYPVTSNPEYLSIGRLDFPKG